MNLFSASQVTDSGCRVILDADSCVVQDRRTQAMVGAGPRSRDSLGLWELDWLRVPSAATSSASSSLVVAFTTSSFQQWHHRLGHLCDSRLSSLVHRGLLGCCEVFLLSRALLLSSPVLAHMPRMVLLSGGIPLERLSGQSPDYSMLRLFVCVCYVLLAPRERTKLTAQSVECVFLGYSDEHKGYRCWDPVGRRMRISRDVTFDETRPFYPRPTAGTYPVEDISFLLFPDTPPSTPIVSSSGSPSPDVSSSTPSSSAPSSSPSSPRSPESSSTIPSSSSSSPASSSSNDLPSTRPVRQRRAPNRYSPSQYGLSVASEPTSYRDAEHHPEWQLAMAEEIAALERTGTWDLVSPPPGVRPITSLFVHTSPRGRTLLLLYVDDMIITGDDPEYIAFVKARLRDQFLMTDLDPLQYSLGIEVSSSDGFYISQEKYIQDLLARAALGDERTVETPMELNVKLQLTDGDPLSEPTRYRHLVGSLVYLAVTRPDISYPVHILSQFVSAPTTVHYSHLLRVLRYLHDTITRRLLFPRSRSFQLQCYSDATWASDPSDRRFLSAYCVFLGGSLIAWKTKKQTAVSRSSVEAELRAMALLTAEVTWLRWLLTDFGVSITTPSLVLSDSTGAISVARDPVKHEFTKHIGVDAFYTRAQVQAQVVALQYVPSDLQLADFFTKAQTRAQHDFLLSKLSVVDPP
uniref:Uncharacterized protein n=1 Tax=Avena sativa TaxID=4498 RepID=A0ACD5WIJ6_AVESA